MVFVEGIRTIRTEISRVIRKTITGDRVRYWKTDLRREDILSRIHVGDSIRREGEESPDIVTGTVPTDGIVYTEKGNYPVNNSVIIGCPGGKGH